MRELFGMLLVVAITIICIIVAEIVINKINKSKSLVYDKKSALKLDISLEKYQYLKNKVKSGEINLQSICDDYEKNFNNLLKNYIELLKINNETIEDNINLRNYIIELEKINS
jgi:hypothetical protein